MLQSALVVLPIVPNLIFKPFAMWVVDGYINDLRNISAMAHRKSLNSERESSTVEDDVEELVDEASTSNGKRTTVFLLESHNGNETPESEHDAERRALILKAARHSPNLGPSTSSSSRINPFLHETIPEE